MEGAEENGYVHKRRHGVNVDETEKKAIASSGPDIAIVIGATARSAVRVRGAPADTSQARMPPGLRLRALLSPGRRRAAARRAGHLHRVSDFFSVSSPFAPFLRL